jgi:hypothetical protein
MQATTGIAAWIKRPTCTNLPIPRNDSWLGKLCNCPRDGRANSSGCRCSPAPQGALAAAFFVATVMKDFANASFPPEVISVMEEALDAAVASLPEPVHSTHVQCLAEAILRAADKGERDPQILQRLALLELQIVRR